MNPGLHLAAACSIAAFFAVEWLWRASLHRPGISNATADRGTPGLLLACYVIMGIALLFAALPGPSIPEVVRWAGVGLAWAGIGVRRWALDELRGDGAAPPPGPGRGLVRSGPFRRVRHPGLLGALAVWLGAAMAFGSLTVILTILVASIATFVHTIPVEEARLRAASGGAFDDYRRNSWRLLPPFY